MAFVNSWFLSIIKFITSSKYYRWLVPKITNLVKTYPGLILLGTFIVVSLFAYKDYGLAWDEQQSRLCGQKTYNYVFHNDDALKSFKDKVYGVGFEFPLVLIEKALNIQDVRNVYLMRHLVTHLFFLFSAFCLYLLINYIYKNKLLAAIGFLLLALNPVLYGHSFFNSKDIPFMSMFIICLLLAAVAFKKDKLKYFLLLGIGCGLLTNIRIMGIMLISIISFFIVMDMLLPGKNKKERIYKVKALLIFLVSASVSLFITWPYLWIRPFGNLIDAFKEMANFRWDGDTLYLGTLVNATKLPWHYSLVYFSVSNPLVYLVFGLFGMILLMINFIRRPFRFMAEKINWNHLIYFICFIGPITAVIVFKSTLYDGWRHLFFIYPGFILLAVYGLHFLLKTKLRSIMLMITFICFGYIAFLMIDNHPFQHIYFNQIISNGKPDKARKLFETDYWGTSFKSSFEYILAHDTASIIKVNAPISPGYMNVEILKAEERKRIVCLLRDDTIGAKYFVMNYRWHPKDLVEFKPYEYHSIKVFNNTINTIFKLKK